MLCLQIPLPCLSSCHTISFPCYLWAWNGLDKVTIDDTSAMLVFQNNRMAAMLKSQTNPVGVEFFRFVNALPCNQYVQMLFDSLLVFKLSFFEVFLVEQWTHCTNNSWDSMLTVWHQGPHNTGDNIQLRPGMQHYNKNNNNNNNNKNN